MILLVVSVAPAYSQNISSDETEKMIREEILSCEKKITSDDSMTKAVKTKEEKLHH